MSETTTNIQEKSPINERYLLNRKEWTDVLQISKRNPAIMMRVGLDYLEDVTKGELDFVDATTPASLLMEFGATLAANNYNYFAQADKQHYPILATEMDDLYHHMNAQLYEGRFASPASAKFRLQFRRDEILKHAVEDGSNNHTRKILLPRGSFIRVNDVMFTLLNHVEIRVSQYGGIDVLYDTRKRDDYQRLDSNMINYWYNTSLEGHEVLQVELDLLQIEKKKYIEGVTHKANVFSKKFSYHHQFIKARVYLVDENNNRKEIRTTHSDLVYDPNEVTARLKVIEGNLVQVDIPMVYYNLDKLDGQSVEVEIYSTRGEVYYHQDTLAVNMSQSTISFNSDDVTTKESQFVAPISLLNYSAMVVSDCIGGNNGLDFATLKKYVIEGGRDEKAEAITHANIKINANIMGYDLITDIDHLTNRIFQATREIEPDNIEKEFARGVGCSIESVRLSLDQLESHPHVKQHPTDRYTILPSALFRTSNGITTLLHDREIPLYNSANIDQYITKVNGLEYIYTPFHYVLDPSNNSFEMRSYFMNDPQINYQSFIDRNYGLGTLVSSDRVTIEKHDKGYSITIITRSDDEYKKLSEQYDNLFCQLAFIPFGQKEYAYINGEFLGWTEENAIFKFNLFTDFDFDKNDNMILTNFFLLSKEKRWLSCPLTHEFRVIFGIYDYQVDNEESKNIPINERAATFLLDRRRDIKVLSENALNVTFGHALTNLWRNARTIPKPAQYKRYTEDVPVRYEKDIFKVGENGYPIYTKDENNIYNFEIEHNKGDVVKDDQGNPVLLYRKGDVMLDENNQPIIAKPKSLERIIDIFFIDGIYRFSTSPTDLNYIKSIPRLVVQWLNQDITKLKARLLENTDLFFIPKKTMGYVKIITENNVERMIFNRLPFKVKFYLTEQAYFNEELKNNIRSMTSRVINRLLQSKTISRDIIEYELRKEGGEAYILGVQVIDMGLGENVNTFTMVDDVTQCSVRRRIVLQSDASLKVKEDISIEFVNHLGKR